MPKTQVPEIKRSCLGTVLALVGAGLAGLFLANPGWGFVAEIPDNLPFVGNLDEVLASAILFSCLSYLGINLPMHWSRGKTPRTELLEDRSDAVVDARQKAT